jgi:phthalate 4,5-dioxygenase oxygenase subunit
MLTKEDNEILCRVGPGTLMGNLLRRYWTPALLSSEVPEPDSPPIRVRILGEDLVAFRDTEGRVGLFPTACPHRGASMFFGRNEEAGLRCVYHGWKFDVTGACVDMPSEPAESNFKNKVRIGAYPVHESGGLVWAYMGPADKQPPFRDFGSEGVPRENWNTATKFQAFCNWVQRNEGQIDSSHISWLHQFKTAIEHPDDGTDVPGAYPSYPMSIKIWAHDRAPRLELVDTEYGYRYAAIRETPNGNTHVRITAYAMPYSTMVASIPFSTGGVMCVPIDDYNCYFFRFATRPLPNAPYREEIMKASGDGGLFAYMPYAAVRNRRFANGNVGERHYRPDNDYLIDRELQKDGTYYTGVEDFGSQDLMVTESMGGIYDRSQEHLGTTDKAIIRMRSLLIKAAKDLANGIEPPALDGVDFTAIRSGEKILNPGEDWRLVGSDEDPVVMRSLGKTEAEVEAVAGGGS